MEVGVEPTAGWMVRQPVKSLCSANELRTARLQEADRQREPTQDPFWFPEWDLETFFKPNPEQVILDATDGVDTIPGQGRLGKKRKGAALIMWIFKNSMPSMKNPSGAKFWGNAEDLQAYQARSTLSPSKRQAIETKARNRRCSNTLGIEIWQIIPK